MSRLGRAVNQIPLINSLQRFVAGEAAEEASPIMFRRPSAVAGAGGSVGGSEELNPIQEEINRLTGNRLPNVYY